MDPSSLPVAQVETELERRSVFRLAFSGAMESHYEDETRASRAWNIRLTVPMGLAAYVAFSFVDTTLLPDLGWLPVLLRLGLIVPVGLFAMWMSSRVGAAFREAFIAIAITLTMSIPVAFVGVSAAPLAPYTILVVLLVCMFGNITMRLRFHWACVFSATTLLCVAAMLHVRSDLPGGLSGAIGIATVACVCFGIVANNQLERSERRSFLLALRERLRSEQLRADRESFSNLSLTDSLTGLPNRRAFDARFHTLWQAWLQGGPSFCLILLDVDFFKRYNDLYGHKQGDVCLIRVSELLKNALAHQPDLVARYGGEEFTILLPDCSLAQADGVARKFGAAIKDASIEHRGREDACAVVTVSAGVACASEPRPGGGPEDMFERADRKLYRAKSAGRDRVVGLVAEAADLQTDSTAYRLLAHETDRSQPRTH